MGGAALGCGTSTMPDVGCVEGGFNPEAGVPTGVCGLEVLACLCSCPARGTLSSCVPPLVSADAAASDAEPNRCASCVESARSTCCPDEIRAFAQCEIQSNADDAGSDGGCGGSNACVAHVCAAQVGALNACLSAGSVGAGANGMACVDALRSCLGSWPLACAPGPDSGAVDGSLDAAD